MKNIILIGMPASFKSSAGELVAKHFDLEFVDTDALIEHKLRMRVVEIFKRCGEAHFRALENQLAHDLSKKENILISCGGGFVLNEQNILVLKKSGIVCYLRASLEAIYERVTNKPNKRPLLNTPDVKKKLEELLKVREPLYNKYCDFEVDTSFITSTQAASEICKKVEEGFLNVFR